jgi:predicted glycoside hydrolase/deacetylase ChbG (UPF0249 family)
LRSLIVNADDFGLAESVNQGVLRAHVHGIVTSTSLMVWQPAAASAAAAARLHPRLSLGLHVDLAEWELCDGQWCLRYDRVDTDDEAAMAAEVDRQLDRFRRLTGQPPGHLDSHQHLHRSQPLAGILHARAGRLGVPLRGSGAARYCGSFWGRTRDGMPYHQAITPSALAALIHQLPDGTTELCCHPAAAAEPGWAYGAERVSELASLCSPLVREAVRAAGVRLVSFAGASTASTPAIQASSGIEPHLVVDRTRWSR